MKSNPCKSFRKYKNNEQLKRALKFDIQNVFEIIVKVIID